SRRRAPPIAQVQGSIGPGSGSGGLGRVIILPLPPLFIRLLLFDTILHLSSNFFGKPAVWVRLTRISCSQLTSAFRESFSPLFVSVNVIYKKAVIVACLLIKPNTIKGKFEFISPAPISFAES